MMTAYYLTAKQNAMTISQPLALDPICHFSSLTFVRHFLSQMPLCFFSV